MRRYLSNPDVDEVRELAALAENLGPAGVKYLVDSAPDDYRFETVASAYVDPMTPKAAAAWANFALMLGPGYFVSSGYNSQLIKRALTPAEVEKAALTREWDRRERAKADATA